MTALDQSIERWLESTAKNIGPQLKRQKLGLSCGNLLLGVGVYRSRWDDIFSCEFMIFQRQFLDDEHAHGERIPLFSQRL